MRYSENCAERLVFSLFLVRFAENVCLLPKLFLTGTELSGLTVILPLMERKVRGERI